MNDIEFEIAVEAMVQGMMQGGDERPFPGAGEIYSIFRAFGALEGKLKQEMGDNMGDKLHIKKHSCLPEMHDIMKEYQVMQKALDKMFYRSLREDPVLVYHDERFKIGVPEKAKNGDTYIVDTYRRTAVSCEPGNVICCLVNTSNVPESAEPKKGRILSPGIGICGFEKAGHIYTSMPGEELLWIGIDPVDLDQCMVMMPLMKEKPDGGMYR
ncbi:hypothetical protein KY362_02530 [Candidatus Woesearchaeota archaeon]|nr:hypothetical protein [Candidatus Woesearchaeota archaeon]